MEQRLPLLTRGAHDLPIRQQAMRATLDWSHDLLSHDERRLFRRLAVFAGGCTVDAAEWVADAGCSEAGNGAAPPGTAARRSAGPLVIDLLADLVDKSLLLTQEDLGGDHRFGMLETIREYGLERLEEAGEENDVRRSHAQWCLELAERAEPELIGADQQRWHDRLSIEHDNLRAALGWAIDQHDADVALRFGGALYRFWANQGHSEEGARWLERALTLADGQVSEPRAHSLIGAGVMAWFQGDYDRAETLWQDALALFRELGNLTGVAYSYGNLGLAADARSDYEGATASYEEALRLFRKLDNRTHVAYMLHNLGLIAHFQEDYHRATALYEEALALEREQGHQTSIAMTLGNLGLLAFAQGDYARARALQEDALALWPFITNKPWLARGVEHFALIAAATNEPERAARLFGAAAGLRARLGSTLPPNDQEFNERYIAQAQEQISADVFAAAWAEGEAMALEEAIDYALAGVFR
jgi:tetratricopeptide (TPR) repeat protein